MGEGWKTDDNEDGLGLTWKNRHRGGRVKILFSMFSKNTKITGKLCSKLESAYILNNIFKNSY